MFSSFLGIFVGAFVRSLVPFLVKLKKNPKLKWDNKYVVSAFVGLVISGIVSYVIFLQSSVELGFGTSFLLGFTLHSLSRDFHKLFGY